MANVKISELPSLSTMTDAGEIPVVSGGTTQQITGANLKTYFTGNVGFVGDTVYDFAGLSVNNSDLSHGLTATLIIPGNGNTTTPIQLTNTYGNITVATGPSGAVASTWVFDNTGNLSIPGSIIGSSTILIDNRATGNTADINLFSADDILLQGRDRTIGDDIEGGDINIYAGDGSPDDAGGGTGTGGDIQIIGGVGGAADVSSGGGGGFVRLDAGNGGDGSATANAGRGGDAYVSAGTGGVVGGLGGGGGGDVTITAGDTTDVAQDRGSVILNAGGGGDETTIGGYVRVSIPAVGTNPGGQWTFTGSGTSLETPSNAEIFGVNAGNLTVGTWGNTIVRTLGAGLTAYDWVFDPTGNLTAPGNIQVQNIRTIEGTVHIGKDTGLTSQSANAVAIGTYAGRYTQGENTVAIGLLAGNNSQGGSSVAVGGGAGANVQGVNSVAVGTSAADQNQGNASTALGYVAGQINQGDFAVAVGSGAAYNGQGNGAIAIGADTSPINQGDYSIAIGAVVSTNAFQPANSIIIDATASSLAATGAGLFIAPVRNDTGNTTNALYYNTSTKEVTYGPGGGGSYGNTNVADFLDSLGSNAIITTGNITGGNIIATANVLGNGYACLTGTFDESQAATAGLYLGYAGGTPRIMFGTGNTSQTFEIDNDGGNLRFYQPGSTKATLTPTGIWSVAGNIITTANISGGNILGGANVNATTYTGTTVSVTANIDGGNLRTAGLVTATGNITGGNIITGGAVSATGNLSATGNVQGGNIKTTSVLIASTTVSASGNITGGNLNAAGLSLSSNVVSALNITGNVTGGNLLTAGLISATGNITGSNISATGNVNGANFVGTGANISLVANVYSSVFDNTGNISFANGTVSMTTASVAGNITVANKLVTAAVTYSSLTAVAGARAFISDANLVAAGGGSFGAQVSGGGANLCPVWSDGVNWYIG